MATRFLKIRGSSDLVALRAKRRGIIDVRFLADASKKCVFVWDAENTIHQQAAKALGSLIQGDYFDVTRFFTGTAELEGTTLTYKNSDMFDGIMRQRQKIWHHTTSKIPSES